MKSRRELLFDLLLPAAVVALLFSCVIQMISSKREVSGLVLPDRRVASLNATLTFSKTEFRYYVRHGLLDRNLCALCLTRSHGLTIKGCWLSRINKRDPLINITGSVVRTGFEPSAALELIV